MQFVLVRVLLCLLVIKLIELDCLSVGIESWLFLVVIGCMLWILNLYCNFTPCVLLLFYYSNVGFFMSFIISFITHFIMFDKLLV